ncbi:MAG: phosphate regulon sensor histidine kinase PhoR [Gammaproteobacteria bacterium]
MQHWRSDLKRFLLVLAATLLLGYLIDQVALTLLLVLACYSLLNFLQLRRLSRWLADNPTSTQSEPPESFGQWGDILDGIYRLQKQERKASAYLENIINKAQESSAALEVAVVMIDKHNKLDWWNLAATTLLGLQFPKDRNQLVTNLIRDPRFSEYFHKENYTQPLKLHAPGDSNRILELEIALFGEHERIMIARDITQLHRLELMRKDFVGNVSHELGTPITVIKGYLEAIIDNMDDLDEKWRKPILQMHQQSGRMENIVKDLLMLSSLETKALPRQRDSINLHKLLHEIGNDTQQAFAAKNHVFTVVCDRNVRLFGDRAELYSAISNLVVNAAKYTPAKGVIDISAGTAGDYFEISVRDDGPGIAAKHIPRLTERFYRVDDSRSSETGGTGLGLAIVKHVLVRHGGELDVQSKLGAGSSFTCRLPLSRVSLAEDNEMLKPKDTNMPVSEAQ